MNNLKIKVPKNADQKTKDLADRINKEVNEQNYYEIFRGAWGDGDEHHGIVEETIRPDEGGILTKLYGCKFLWKGRPMNISLEGIAIGKSLISIIPREIIGKSFVLKSALAFLFLFARKRLYRYLRVYSHILKQNIANKYFNEQLYNTPIRELKRTLQIVLEREYKESGIREKVKKQREKRDLDMYDEFGVLIMDADPEKSDLLEAIYNFAQFIFFFLEYDNAYRFRLQDVIENLDKDNIRKNGIIDEIKRLFDFLISRENKGLATKWKQMRKIVIPFLYFSKKARRLTKEFFLELDTGLVAMDEHDWYFVLQRTDYQFGGLSVEERKEEKKRIDQQYGNIPVVVTDKDLENIENVEEYEAI